LRAIAVRRTASLRSPVAEEVHKQWRALSLVLVPELVQYALIVPAGTECRARPDRFAHRAVTRPVQ
jgi:hypothetical protein